MAGHTIKNHGLKSIAPAMKMSEWMEPGLHRDFVAEETDAVRLCTTPEGWVERFGSDILISHKNDAILERLSAELYLWTLNVGYSFQRIFTRHLPKQNADRVSPKLKLGDATSSLQTTATERRLHYGIDFSAGYSAGLFIDQRENRRFVRELRPKTLLNCFAYTCSFSVAAASVGAKTTSVDLSKKSLARGKENFALNSLSAIDHKFIADDVNEVLPRLARKGAKFDAIILDPPTFSRSKRGKAFKVEQDFEPLLLAALELIEREGHILLSTNCSTLDARGLEVMGRYGLKASRRAGTFHRPSPLPDFPRGAGASTIWMKVR